MPVKKDTTAPATNAPAKTATAKKPKAAAAKKDAEHPSYKV